MIDSTIDGQLMPSHDALVAKPEPGSSSVHRVFRISSWAMPALARVSASSPLVSWSSQTASKDSGLLH
eukprot:11227639-Lingulodinium_polyedra.AAC.1